MKYFFGLTKFPLSLFLALALIFSPTLMPAGSSAGIARSTAISSSCLAPELTAADDFALLWENFTQASKNLTLVKKHPKFNKFLKIGATVSAVSFIPLLSVLKATNTPWTDLSLFFVFLGIGSSALFIKPFIAGMKAISQDDEDFGIKEKIEEVLSKVGLSLEKVGKATGRVITAVFFAALLAALLTTILPRLSLVESSDILAKYEVELSAEEQLALEEIYSQPIVQEANAALLKSPLYERILNNPQNIRAITDAAYYQQVPSSMIMAVLTTETNTVGMEFRQSAEAFGRAVRNKDTTTTGIAEMQLINAVSLLPRLYSDIMSDPAAPVYIRQALINQQQGYMEELGEDIFDPAVIGRTNKNGNLVFDKEIADILQDDNISLYLCAMFVKDTMAILHESDPLNFPDPANYNDRSTDLPATYSAAIQISYIQSMTTVLNPNNVAVLQKVCGRTDVPIENIYKMKIAVPLSYGYDTMTFMEYLTSGRIESEINWFVEDGNKLTLSSVMAFFYDVWIKTHVMTDNKDMFSTLGHAVEGIGNYRLFSSSDDFSVMDVPVTWDEPAAGTDAAATASLEQAA